MGRLLGSAGVLTALCALCGCAQSTTATSSLPSCQSRVASGSPATAEHAAVAYVQLVDAHRYDEAARATEPCTTRQYADIRKLWKFMAGMPVGHSRVVASGRPAGAQPGSVDVAVTVYVQFGTPPYASWITAATRTLRLDHRTGGWRVTTDETTSRAGQLAAYG